MSNYNNILNKISHGQCVILDGAIATEIQRTGDGDFQTSDDTHWGFDALHLSPDTVLKVHQSYLDAGADILTTNTYSVLDAPNYTSDYDIHISKPIHWMDLARKSIELPRRAIAASGDAAAVAFSIGGEIESLNQKTTMDLLLKVFSETPPDLILFESLSLIEDNLTFEVIQKLLHAGLPVWVSFRRCRKGVCGIHGQLWGGPEGDRFGRLAQSFEQIGVGALLINCLPINRVQGTLPWIRDFTDIPLGVYPNLGRYSEAGWEFTNDVSPVEFSEIALQWREEGAQIIGGCCGVGPDEIAILSKTLIGVDVGSGENSKDARIWDVPMDDLGTLKHWKNEKGIDLYPLPLPKLVVDSGVFVPTQGSYLIWKHLFNGKIGQGKSCLDVGCGVGILAIQMALNGANDVTAVDIDKKAVDNTLTNAFRNHVSENFTGLAADLYSFAPKKRFDVIVASLYQMPTDPRGKTRGHRDIDYWGRNLLDHFVKNLDNYLVEDGTAYLMQVSMLGAKRTEDLLVRYGFEYKIVDFNLYQFNPVFRDNLEQIDTVENLSDAYHFKFGADEHAMVMYLMEITQTRSRSKLDMD